MLQGNRAEIRKILYLYLSAFLLCQVVPLYIYSRITAVSLTDAYAIVQRFVAHACVCACGWLGDKGWGKERRFILKSYIQRLPEKLDCFTIHVSVMMTIPFVGKSHTSPISHGDDSITV